MRLVAKLVIHPEKIGDTAAFIRLCPFGALEERDGTVQVSAACKMCRLCVRKGPPGAAEYVEDTAAPAVDKSQWSGVAVYADHEEGVLHPVTFELIGKARELAAVIRQPVRVLLMGGGVSQAAHELLHYGADEVYVCDDPALRHFSIEPYAAVFEAFIAQTRPAAILVGATAVGRQLAPRVAARLKTGLTADCTVLEMNENTDLVQIRPAFGGNIMAEIVTPNHRPQMATVRYKVMNAPERSPHSSGQIVRLHIDPTCLKGGVQVLEAAPKPEEKYIESADVLVVAGRGVKKEEDLAMLEELASLLGGQLACTRPMAEAGWIDARRQVGLSGRTVRPRLIITCGVSGAIQFVAGMDHAETIVAINRDEKAPIFRVAHYGLVGDLYEIVPHLLGQLRERKEAAVCANV